MKQAPAALILIVGLGSCFSVAQGAPSKDPFARYLSGVKVGTPEVAFQKFASECGVNLSKSQPRYAVGAGSSFAPVKNLARGLQSLETDFYSTAEVWTSGRRVLVEIWANSDDVGSEVRYYECFSGGNLTRAEVVDWNVPVEEGDPKAWGYARRWERAGNGELKCTKAEFVDGVGRTVPKPKPDSEGEKSLLWMPFLGSLDDWKLPPSILR